MALLILRHEARAGELQFSPSSCATDPGNKIHLALGHTVFRVPLDSLVYILDLTQDDPLAPPPKVPDPNVPEGCPGRPVQAKAYTLRVRESELLGQTDPSEGTDAQFVPFRLVWTSPNYWGTQLSAERRYKNRCSAFGVWEELQNGLVSCRVKYKEAPELNQNSAIILQARPEIYSTPLGRPFVIGCLPRLGMGSQSCDNVYKLHPTVRFVRRFDLQRVDVNDLVDVDRALRAWIEDARVEDFQWPTSDSP